MPRYNHKRNDPMNPEEFDRGIQKQTEPSSSALLLLIYYTGVRISEAINLMVDDIEVTDNHIFISIARLKGSKQTSALQLPRTLRHIHALTLYVQHKEAEQTIKKIPVKLWDFSRTKAYRICYKAFNIYPHFFRLSRITNLLLLGATIPEIRSYTGLTVSAIEYYIGKVSITKLGEMLT